MAAQPMAARQWPPTNGRASALPPDCRECWAQAPQERPPFDAVVPRLRSLLELAASSRKPAEPVRYRTLQERPAWRF